MVVTFLLMVVCLCVGAICIAIQKNKHDKEKAGLNNKIEHLNEIRVLLNDHVKGLDINIDELLTNNKDLETQLNKTVHQKKSSEVRLGRIGEQLAPFTNGWPWDSNHFRFLGSPVDGVQFTDDEILFVEIKTGKSRLSKYQAVCKDLVEKGKVRFVTFRMDEDGIEIK